MNNVSLFNLISNISSLGIYLTYTFCTETNVLTITDEDNFTTSEITEDNKEIIGMIKQVEKLLVESNLYKQVVLK